MTKQELSYIEQQQDFMKTALVSATRCGVDVKQAEFTIIQPFDDTQAFILIAEYNEEGERVLNLKVTDAVVVLPKIEGTLDIFGGDEDE